MGFIRSSSYDGKGEMAEKSQKRLSSKLTTTTTEVVLSECCKKCRMNKIYLYAITVMNVILLPCVIILFVMIIDLKSDFNDKLLVRRPKSIKPEKVYQPSPIPVNTLHTDHLKQSNFKHFNMLNISIPKFDSVSTTPKNTNKTSTLNDKNTIITSNAPPTTTTTTQTETGTTSRRSPTYLKALEVMDQEGELQKLPQVPKDPKDLYKQDSIFITSDSNCTCLGPRGPPGKPGQKGERGRRGRKGIGPRGYPGVQGDKGQRGLNGRPGKPGPQGDVGSVGIQGPQGPAGPKGESGVISIDERPVVHLTGYAFAAQLKDMPTGLVTNLQHADGFGDLVGGFKYDDGIITIPKYGFYHIYSQIFFQHDVGGLDPMLIHYVYLFRKTEKWILMQSYVSKPDHTKSNQAFFTTNTGGVFRLLQGDKIALGVDPIHLPLISYAESTTYFGAYLI